MYLESKYIQYDDDTTCNMEYNTDTYRPLFTIQNLYIVNGLAYYFHFIKKKCIIKGRIILFQYIYFTSKNLYMPNSSIFFIH